MMGYRTRKALILSLSTWKSANAAVESARRMGTRNRGGVMGRNDMVRGLDFASPGTAAGLLVKTFSNP
jgi:hypothetical protein